MMFHIIWKCNKQTINHPLSNQVPLQKPFKKANYAPKKVFSAQSLCFLVLIYDYYTDIQVAMLWIAMPDALSAACSQFRCNVVDDSVIFSSAVILIACSSIGVLVGTAGKVIEALVLYSNYKNPTDNEQRTLQLTRHKLLNGWVPIIIEDFVSLYLISNVVQSSNLWNVRGQNTYEYRLSVIITTLKLSLTVLLSMRKARKLDKNLIKVVQENQSNQNPYGHVHQMEETCFCCIWNCSDFAISKWTYCWTIIMFFVCMITLAGSITQIFGSWRK
eukprot:894916_1